MLKIPSLSKSKKHCYHDNYVKSYLPVWRAWPGIIKDHLDKQNKLIEENNKLISELNDRINNLVNKKFAIWSTIIT